MKVFIPICDDELERWPDDQLLVPYRPGLQLLSQLEAPAAAAPEPAATRCEAATPPREERSVSLSCRN